MGSVFCVSLYRKGNRQTDRQIDRVRQTNGQIDRQIDRDRQTD